jgi:tetratricopeptide (TPR) repeat protein
MGAGRYEDAVASFDEMLQLEPNSYRAYYSQGLSYYYLERWDEALEAYDLALEQKETVNVLNNIGLVYDKLGKKKKAQEYYKAAKALN